MDMLYLVNVIALSLQQMGCCAKSKNRKCDNKMAWFIVFFFQKSKN